MLSEGYNHIITPIRAGLRHCRWPRPRHAVRLATLARSRLQHNENLLLVYYTGRQSILVLVGRRSK